MRWFGTVTVTGTCGGYQRSVSGARSGRLWLTPLVASDGCVILVATPACGRPARACGGGAPVHAGVAADVEHEPVATVSPYALGGRPPLWPRRRASRPPPRRARGRAAEPRPCHVMTGHDEHVYGGDGDAGRGTRIGHSGRSRPRSRGRQPVGDHPAEDTAPIRCPARRRPVVPDPCVAEPGVPEPGVPELKSRRSASSGPAFSWDLLPTAVLGSG
jgi:hypothetical protein